MIQEFLLFFNSSVHLGSKSSQHQLVFELGFPLSNFPPSTAFSSTTLLSTTYVLASFCLEIIQSLFPSNSQNLLIQANLHRCGLMAHELSRGEMSLLKRCHGLRYGYHQAIGRVRHDYPDSGHSNAQYRNAWQMLVGNEDGRQQRSYDPYPWDCSGYEDNLPISRTPSPKLPISRADQGKPRPKSAYESPSPSKHQSAPKTSSYEPQKGRPEILPGGGLKWQKSQAKELAELVKETNMDFEMVRKIYRVSDNTCRDIYNQYQESLAKKERGHKRKITVPEVGGRYVWSDELREELARLKKSGKTWDEIEPMFDGVPRKSLSGAYQNYKHKKLRDRAGR